eukprot:6480432-Amphidinium_carterae.2
MFGAILIMIMIVRNFYPRIDKVPDDKRTCVGTVMFRTNMSVSLQGKTCIVVINGKIIRNKRCVVWRHPVSMPTKVQSIMSCVYTVDYNHTACGADGTLDSRRVTSEHELSSLGWHLCLWDSIISCLIQFHYTVVSLLLAACPGRKGWALHYLGGGDFDGRQALGVLRLRPRQVGACNVEAHIVK